jgi:hypothetical protein
VKKDNADEVWLNLSEQLQQQDKEEEPADIE